MEFFLFPSSLAQISTQLETHFLCLPDHLCLTSSESKCFGFCVCTLLVRKLKQRGSQWRGLVKS